LVSPAIAGRIGRCVANSIQVVDEISVDVEGLGIVEPIERFPMRARVA